MARQSLGRRSGEEVARATRTLVRAGCRPEELRQILAFLRGSIPSEPAFSQKVTELAAFASDLGRSAARDYFRAIRETRAVAELTDDRVIRFARSLDPHTAEWYFWAIWGTRGVRELTDESVLEAVRFFRSIDSPATVEYFLAIRETSAPRELTRPHVLALAESLGSEAAAEYFGAIWETKAVAELTDPKLTEFASAIGPDVAKEYFAALRSTQALRFLMGDEVFAFARALGREPAREYFRAIRETGAVEKLTSESVRLFVESVGRSPAVEYFRVLARTKAVGPLTSPRVLGAAGVIRSIGRDAALDYFLAAVTTSAAPGAAAEPSAGSGASEDASVPVLTLLDLPRYGRYQPVALVAASASFWIGLWRFSSIFAGGSAGAWGLPLAFAAWIALLGGAYLLLRLVSQQLTDQFVATRRRLLNEHGIRWHDCRESGARCPVCWNVTGSLHRDEQFDYEGFCRCPACARALA